MSESDLTAKQERALVALMGARTLDDAAVRAEVGQRTLRRWLQQDAFQAAFRRLRQDAMGAATAHLQNVAWEAVEALRSILTDDAAPPGARVSAARTLLDQAQRAVELEDLALRIDQLEARVRGTASCG